MKQTLTDNKIFKEGLLFLSFLLVALSDNFQEEKYKFLALVFILIFLGFRIILKIQEERIKGKFDYKIEEIINENNQQNDEKTKLL